MKTTRRPIVAHVARRGQTQESKEVGSGDRISSRVELVDELDIRLKLENGQEVLVDRQEFAEPPQVGDQAQVTLLLQYPTGAWVGTTREPRAEIKWDEVRRGELVSGRVIEMKPVGLTLQLNGARGFVPSSHLGRNTEGGIPKQFQRNRFAGEIVEYDKRKGEVVVGLRKLLDRREDRNRRHAMARFEQGEVISGTITRLNQHGAFIDVGGVEGLLHESKILKHMQESKESAEPVKIEVGEKINVEVLSKDPKRGRVGLGFARDKKSQSNWSDLVSDYEIDERVTGLVSAVDESGCRVILEERVTGWLPKEELASLPTKGSLVSAQVAEIDTSSGRIRLKSC